MAFQGREKGGGRIRKNSKGAIAGLVSAEAWQPGPDPLEGGSWRRVFRIPPVSFSSAAPATPVLSAKLQVDLLKNQDHWAWG